MWKCKAVVMLIDRILTSLLQDYQATDVFWIQYQSIISFFIYAILSTGLDLTFLVLVVSRYASNWNQSHWQLVKCIFCYICSTLLLQLTYCKMFSNLEGYIDADWAEDYDTCRSTSGYIFNIGIGIISLSLKQ